MSRRLIAATVAAFAFTSIADAQPAPPTPSRANILRGEYGRYRANNDLLFYHLDVRVDPEKKFLSGKNTIRFKMLQDDTRIQLDLYANLTVEKITFGRKELKYERELNAVFIDFPETLKKGPRVRDRLPLLGQRRARPAASAASTFAQGSGGQPLDQHRLRRTRRQHLVAEQGSVARRAGVDAAQRVDPQRSRRRLERQVHGQDRSRRRLHALGLADSLPDQLVQRLVEHREVRPLLRSPRRSAARLLRAGRRTWRRRSSSSRRQSR